MGTVISSKWIGRYEEALEWERLCGKALAGGPPACHKIEGEFIANAKKATNPCSACTYQPECKEVTEFLMTEARIYDKKCIGNSSVHNLTAPSSMCRVCRFNRACGDIVHALQRGGFTASGAETRSSGSTESTRIGSRDAAIESETTPRISTAKTPHAPEPARYRFPYEAARFASTLTRARAAHRPETLLELIERVSCLAPMAGGGPYEYQKIRSEFCALSIALNERGVFPPSLRTTRRLKALPAKAKRSREESDLGNDLQVIDVHWAACTGMGKPQMRWEPLLSGKPFPFDLASEFSATIARAEVKAEQLLGMTELEQHYFHVLHARPVADRLHGIRRGRQKVDLHVRAEDPRSRLSSDRAALMPGAYVALRFAAGSITVASRVIPVIAGLHVTPAVMRKCKDWLKAQHLLKTPD